MSIPKMYNIKIQKLLTCHSFYISPLKISDLLLTPTNKTKTGSNNKTQKNITEQPMFVPIISKLSYPLPSYLSPKSNHSWFLPYPHFRFIYNSKYFPNSSDALHSHYHNHNPSHHYLLSVLLQVLELLSMLPFLTLNFHYSQSTFHAAPRVMFSKSKSDTLSMTSHYSRVVHKARYDLGLVDFFHFIAKHSPCSLHLIQLSLLSVPCIYQVLSSLRAL